MMNNRWVCVSDTRYIHPEIGTLMLFRDTWEATPRPNLGYQMRTFARLEDAAQWMESLIPTVTVHSPNRQ
jgi:hypothetical protein